MAIDVGERLRLDALARIDNEQRASQADRLRETS